MALEEFGQNNPKVFQEDGSVKFSARLTWIVANEEPHTDDGLLVRWDNVSDDSGIVSVDEPDGLGAWEEFWRFHYDINHRCEYDAATNSLKIADKRGYVEVIIEYDLSVVELLALQTNLS